ncbi:TPA: hypothetical protein RG892_000332 [Pseudomonas aeruginosa]|nr:hypothetical protein [Pseudomonas aeruginosa]
MDRQLIKHIENSMPKFNKLLVDGFHQKEFSNALGVFDHSMRAILKSVEKRGVFYKKTIRASPREFIDYLINSSRKVFDVHKESLYPVKIWIQYKDRGGKLTDFYTYTMLPYTDKYGDLWLRGSLYNPQIVLAEQGLPVTKENALFVKVLGFKFKIGIEHFNFCQVFTDTGIETHRHTDINLAANRFYSPTESRKIKDSKTPVPLLAWYIFADMGFSTAMEEYAECDFRIGSLDALLNECKAEDRWEVFTGPKRASDNKPSLGDYVSLDIGIAVRNKSSSRKELSAVGLQYSCALLFIANCCSSYFDIERLDDPDYWKLIIGRCSVKAGDSDEYIMRLMYEHFDSIREYLDEDSIKKFAAKSIVVTNMFDLFNYIIANRSEIVQTTDRASAFNKDLASLEFTLDSLLTSANNFKHDIKNNSEINQKKVARFLTHNFPIKEIDNAQYANLILEPTPTDNPFVDYGLGCMPQHKVYTGGGKRKRGDFDTSDSSTFTHASLPFVHSFLRVTNPNPDARGFLNPSIYLINNRTTGLDPQFKELYERTDKRLKKREPWPWQTSSVHPDKSTEEPSQ